jgi:hypothetical protein
MNVGLPGTGIGGLFYLITALAMPVAEWIRSKQGNRCARRQARAFGSAALASLVLATLCATSWVVDYMVAEAAPAGPRPDPTGFMPGALGVAPTVITLASLAIVVLLVECAAWWAMPRQGKRTTGQRPVVMMLPGQAVSQPNSGFRHALRRAHRISTP